MRYETWDWTMIDMSDINSTKNRRRRHPVELLASRPEGGCLLSEQNPLIWSLAHAVRAHHVGGLSKSALEGRQIIADHWSEPIIIVGMGALLRTLYLNRASTPGRKNVADTCPRRMQSDTPVAD